MALGGSPGQQEQDDPMTPSEGTRASGEHGAKQGPV